ncbi:MAG: ATP-grasp domain-containing protein [Spirochaetes bacterium]|nr:ATP-grasp domain-containing protein [Spirochaetota bacterium]
MAEKIIEKKNAVVILGAGIMQVLAIKSASKMGFVTIAFDGNIDAPGKNFPDYFENIDLKDRGSLLEKSRAYTAAYDIKAVFTVGTDFSYMVAWLSEKLGIKSLSYETALKATDKSLMRQAFSSAKVSSPQFLMVTGSEQVEPISRRSESRGQTKFAHDRERRLTKDMQSISFLSIEKIEKMGYPLVVKPVDSMGARGTVKIHNFDDLKEAIEEAIKYSRTGKVIIEQFLEGPEFSLDAVVKEGQIHICGVADRHIYFPPYFVEMGHTMPTIFPQDVVEKVVNVFCDGIKAIGIDNGAAKGDIKYTNGKAVIGEIAARLSGGYMSGWTFPYSSGFSVIDAALKIALDIDPGEIKYSYEKTAAERAFISIPGVVDSVFIPDYLKNDSPDNAVKVVFVNVKPGDVVNFPKNNVEKSGNVIAAHENRDEAVFAAEEACRNIIVKLKPADETTFSFIFKEKENWIPDAFVFDRGILDSMPDFYGDGAGLTGDSGKIDVFLPADFDFSNSGNSDERFGRDWHGNSLKKALETIESHANIRFIKEFPAISDRNKFVLGKIFWKSIKKGSIQGAIWVAETIADYIRKGNLNSIKWT